MNAMDYMGGGGSKYPPCLNPHCKSYGKSHPNCKCWGEKEVMFADGGNVAERFCDMEQAHMPGCEHYSGASFVDCMKAKRR